MLINISLKMPNITSTLGLSILLVGTVFTNISWSMDHREPERRCTITRLPAEIFIKIVAHPNLYLEKSHTSVIYKARKSNSVRSVSVYWKETIDTITTKKIQEFFDGILSNMGVSYVSREWNFLAPYSNISQQGLKSISTGMLTKNDRATIIPIWSSRPQTNCIFAEGVIQIFPSKTIALQIAIK